MPDIDSKYKLIQESPLDGLSPKNDVIIGQMERDGRMDQLLEQLKKEKDEKG